MLINETHLPNESKICITLVNKCTLKTVMYLSFTRNQI